MHQRSISHILVTLALSALTVLALAAPSLAAVRVLRDRAHGQPAPSESLDAIAAKLGLEFVFAEQAITPATLEGIDILYLRTPTQPLTAAEKEAIVAFVKKGGSLFLVLDEERRQSLAGTGVNDVIAPFGLRLTADAKVPHNTGAVARAGDIHKADREVPYSGGRAVDGGTPFSLIMGEDGKPTSLAHGAYTTAGSGGRVVVLGDAMVTLLMGSPDGKRLQGTTFQDTVYWGKDSAAFMEEVFAWLAATKK